MFEKCLVRQHILNHHLSMVQLGRSDHLHGTRNLTCAVDTGNARFNFFQRWHYDWSLGMKQLVAFGDVSHNRLDDGSHAIVNLSTAKG